jgi:phospholipid/cholesterol/gamma-HCH transport system substrate-binding protein
MKISNETKVGILTITALTLLILGFNFLKGKELFNRSKKIYAIFKDLGPLSKSNEVKINGYVIGKVYALEAKDKDVTGIIATINLTEDVNIPADSKAFISSPLVGSSFIAIDKGDSSVFLKPGDTLNTRRDNGLFDDVKAQLNPTLDKVRQGIDSLTSVFNNINTLFTSKNKDHIHQILANLNQATNSLNTMLDKETSMLAKTLQNTNSITENIKANNDSITATISNVKRLTGKLADLELNQTIDSIQAVVTQLKTTVAKIGSSDGTLGALINDKALYNKLNDAILSAEILMDDLRAHPKRYVNLSIFGKKDKDGPLTSPSKKDSVPTGNK